MYRLETEAATGEPCMEEAIQLQHLLSAAPHHCHDSPCAERIVEYWNLFSIKAAIWISCGKCNGKQVNTQVS
jgi:hypothetical protein